MAETEFARAERYMHETWRLEKEIAKLRKIADALVKLNEKNPQTESYRTELDSIIALAIACVA